jgi:hypothetical protein
MSDSGFQDLTGVIRAIARDELATSTRAAWGYVVAYDPTTALVQVRLPVYQDPSTSTIATTPWIPLGSPYVGGSYGLECYPELGTPCLVYIVETQSGAGLAAVLLHNKNVQAPGIAVNPGEFAVSTKSGSVLYMDQDGNVEVHAKNLKVTASSEVTLSTQTGADTPVAVEGSTVTHYHTLETFVTGLIAAFSAKPSAPTLTSGAIATILSTAFPAFPAESAALTDIAGTEGTTVSQVDAGAGAQNVLAPPPGAD